VWAQEVGGFPSRTITEDYALGMELNKAGYGLRYLPAYLATGGAPDAMLQLPALPAPRAGSGVRVAGSVPAWLRVAMLHFGCSGVQRHGRAVRGCGDADPACACGRRRGAGGGRDLPAALPLVQGAHAGVLAAPSQCLGPCRCLMLWCSSTP